MPEEVTRASTVVLVNLHEPVLVANGNNQVTVISRINYRVRVRPVRIRIRMPDDVQGIELIPDPYGFVILVQIDQHISGHRHSRNYLLQSSKHNHAVVGQRCEIIVRPDAGRRHRNI